MDNKNIFKNKPKLSTAVMFRGTEPRTPLLCGRQMAPIKSMQN